MKLYRTHSNKPEGTRIWRVCLKELCIVMWDDEPLREGSVGVLDMIPMTNNSTLVFNHRC